MRSKQRSIKEIDPEQHEMLEKAQSRIRQKKRLYYHFVIFLLGSVFMIVLNKVLKYGEQYDWFVWAISGWAFLFIIHFINVYITSVFLGKEWEREQREKLVLKQKTRIAALQKEVEKEHPLPQDPTKTPE
ncbi:2TM domain-containing protein [Robertkochia sediminum]|uniref:2TM domain-containing protein n=1 Tax=Robertkochia sediminum TaxID=2785326 RepID=UPI0019316C80|nr:2TM domain-containing protein [Robertkochia sediminum]MBL7472418.1 2TM domain-containing protein [Robertkochia sediminum]